MRYKILHLSYLPDVGKKLMKKYPMKEKDIRLKLVDTTDNWKRLQDLETSRNAKLKEARDWHQFFAQYQDLNTWTQDIIRCVLNLILVYLHC